MPLASAERAGRADLKDSHKETIGLETVMPEISLSGEHAQPRVSSGEFTELSERSTARKKAGARFAQRAPVLS